MLTCCALLSDPGSNGGTLLLSAATALLANSSVWNDGGALVAHAGGMAYVTHPTSVGSTQAAEERSTLRLVDTSVTGASAALGGAISLYYARLLSTRSVIQKTSATSFGGAVFATVRGVTTVLPGYVAGD